MRSGREHLNRTLFKAAPQAAVRRPGWEGAVLLAGFLLLAVILQPLRIGPGIALDSLWAEDGPIFLQGAIEHGFWTDLWTTYAGYLVFVPRLIGEAAHLVPLRDAAAVVSLLSAAVVAVCGYVVWVASAAHVRNPWLRGSLAALAVLAPTAALESVASAAYVPWYMLLPVFWLLIWRPPSTGAALLGGLFILLTALSTPGTWFFLPLAALRAIAVRDRRDAILVGSWALGSAIQIPAMLLEHEEHVQPLWSNDIWAALLQRVLDGAALGERVGGKAWELLGWPLLIALLALAAVGLYLGLRRSGAGARWIAGLAVPTAVAMFVVSVYQRAVGSEMTWPAGDSFGAGGRYTIVPALLLLSAALVIVEATARRNPALGRRLVAATAVVLIGGLLTSFYVRSPSARGTPSWSDSLDAARAECEAGAAVGSVAISPRPFSLSVGCDELASD